jgi:DNA repair photolyase
VELLADMSRRAPVSVSFSVPFADDALARLVEPGAPRPSKRLEAMRILADAGVRVGVLFAPVIPGLNDDGIPEVLERARDAGARYAGRVALRLPYSVKEVFLERLRATLPDRAKRVESRIREMRGGQLNENDFGSRMNGKGVYWGAIDAMFDLHHRRLGYAEMEAEDDARPETPRLGEQMGLFG